MAGRRWAGRLATLAAATVAALGVATPAWAHSELARSDPANGGLVAPGRTSLRLWFEEPVDPRVITFRVESTTGERPTVRAVVAADGRAVRLDTDPLRVGTYELDWRVSSLVDGHVSTGTLVFGAGVRPPVVPDAGGDVPPAEMLILRWLDLAAVLVAIGALSVSGRVLGGLGELGGRPRRRARLLALLATVGAAYAALVTPFVRTFATDVALGTWLRETWSTLSETPWGLLWLARVMVTVAAAVSVWVWRRGEGRNPVPARLALLGLAGGALLLALAGHATSLPRLTGVAAAMSAGHVVAAGVWAGGLVVLVVCLVPLMRAEPDLRGVVLSSVWRTYSPMAATASVVLVATGLYEAGRHLPGLSSLTATVYGGAVAAKSLLLVAALALAGANLLLVNPTVAQRTARLLGRPEGWTPVPRERFVRTVTIEALVLGSAVVLAAVLTTSPTSREVVEANRVTAPRTATVDGLYISFEDVVTAPGRSRLVARVRSTVLPPPAPVTGVDVSLVGPGGRGDLVTLAPVQEGEFEGRTTVTATGAWSATVRVHRQGLPDSVMGTAWRVTPPPGSHATRLEVTSTALATVLLMGLLVVLARRTVRSRRSRVEPATALGAAREQEVSLS